MSRILRVVIVDRDPLARRALVRTLEAEPDLRVVAAVATSEEATEVTAETDPDVVVVDIVGMGPDDLDVISAVTNGGDRPATMVLSRIDDADLALRALRLGARGFLPKRVSFDVLPRIVRAVDRGEAVLSRVVTTRLVEVLREMPEGGHGLRPVRSDLSSREWEVLDLLRAGAGTVDIAEELDMAPETVRSHIKHILRKLDAHTREEAVAWAERLVQTAVR